MSIKIFYFPRLWSCHNLFQELQQVFSLYINVFTNFFGSDAWNLPDVILAIILLLILATGFLRKCMARTPKENFSHARTSLQALQTVLVPTCSLWPTRYIQLVKRASPHSGHRSGSKIVVPLSMLLQDVCDGVIELRDPVSDLEDLMDSGISAYGCYVCLSIDWKWWVEWLDRILRGDISDHTKSGNIVHSSYLPAGTQPVRRFAMATSPFLDKSIINLDSRPLSHLATIQLPRGSRATLEFTSLSGSIIVLSTTHMLCMIPFLKRRLPHRLSDVLAAVDDTRNFTLSSLSNSSATYANALLAASMTLTNDPVARKRYVDKAGVKGWRERRFMLEFEATLLRKGWMEHWEVVLEAR